MKVRLNLGIAHAKTVLDQSQIDLTTVELGTGIGKELGSLGLHGGTSMLITLPDYGDEIASGDDRIVSWKLQGGVQLPLWIVRLLLEASWVDGEQSNLYGRLAFYW